MRRKAWLGGPASSVERPRPAPCSLPPSPLWRSFGSYCPSLASVLRAQVGGKPMPGGREAFGHLAEDAAMAQVLDRMLGLGDGGRALQLSASVKAELEALDSGLVDRGAAVTDSGALVTDARRADSWALPAAGRLFAQKIGTL